MQFPEPEPQEKPEFRFSPKPNKAAEINWHKWSEDAFSRAKAEGKPILMAISAVWCHWCHVMDETSYSDPDVIRLLNEKFIPIRVDADKRPDIQNRYLLGGWPTTAILTGQGDVITGGTYIPPEQLRPLLERAYEYYQGKRGGLEAEGQRKRDMLVQAHLTEKIGGFKIGPNIVNEIVQSLEKSFDSRYGGFGLEPKFPNPPAVDLLLRRAFLENEARLLEMAAITLDQMASGEVFDHVWGGFFRYATQRDWGSPHYEKLLSDNAALIVNYLNAYQVSERLNYRSIAEKTLGYVDMVLADEARGGFAGSQDADEQFYKLGADERSKGKMPYIDRIVYIDSNAMMVSAYVKAFEVLGNRDYLDFARKTTDFLLANCYSPEQGMAHFYETSPQFLGLLSDQAHTIGALLDTYNITGERSYIEASKSLVDFCERTMRAQNGAFYDKADTAESAIGALIIKNKPIQENAVMARNIYRLAYLTGDDRFEAMAVQTLSDIDFGGMDPIPAIALYGLAVDEVLTEPVILTVIGRVGEPGTVELLREAWRRYIPGKEIKFLDYVNDFDAIRESGFPPERHPALYPCIGRMCLPAIETGRELNAILEDLPGRLRPTA